MLNRSNPEFKLSGLNHVALVCKDMARTVEFYRDVLGMPLIKTLDLPDGLGQHFFFDIGNGDSIAFFWFPNAPQAAPGIASPVTVPGGGDFLSAHGSMNHIAFNVPLEEFESYHTRLKAKGVAVSPIVNHDNSPSTVSETMHPGVFIRSMYFLDPDGICLEFAAWSTILTDSDVSHEPCRADGSRASGLVRQHNPILEAVG